MQRQKHKKKMTRKQKFLTNSNREMEAAQKRHRTHLFGSLTNNADDLRLVKQAEGGVARLCTLVGGAEGGRGCMKNNRHNVSRQISIVSLYNYSFIFLYMGAK